MEMGYLTNIVSNDISLKLVLATKESNPCSIFIYWFHNTFL